MKIVKLQIGGIPAIVWGEPSDKVYIHVHGKMSRKEYAEDFAKIAEQKGYQTLSFDLPEHGERTDSEHRCDVWNGVHDLNQIADYTFANWNNVSLYACSLGAYFSLQAYADRPFANCLFQSPVLDMEYLVEQMFQWFDITANKLQAEREIVTPVDLMTWDYYQYVKSHPVTHWRAPTKILYGAKDNMQSLDVMEVFANENHCKLTLSENSEHPFMAESDAPIVAAWLEENI